MARRPERYVLATEDGRVLATDVRVARGMLGRLRGLLGRPPLEAGAGLLFQPCNGVHTFGMGYPIDVLFLDRDDRVCRVVVDLRPGRMVPYVRGAKRAIELRAHALDGLHEGDQLLLARVVLARRET